MNEAEKHIKHAMAEIEYNNFSGCCNFILQTVQVFNKHAKNPPQYQFQAYQPKGNIQPNLTQR